MFYLAQVPVPQKDDDSVQKNEPDDCRNEDDRANDKENNIVSYSNIVMKWKILMKRMHLSINLATQFCFTSLHIDCN